jgi:antitoxin component of MazEF toxin-antitoxin module
MEAAVATQITQNGGTVTVEIPEKLLREAKLAVGDTLTDSGALALRPHGAEPVEDGYEVWAQAEIEAGLRDADAGNTVSGDEVVAWLRSWGTEHELPPPQ